MVLKEFYDYKKQINSDDKIWLDWAKKKLDWYDPAKNIDDSLLDEVNKYTLELKKKNYWDQYKTDGRYSSVSHCV